MLRKRRRDDLIADAIRNALNEKKKRKRFWTPLTGGVAALEAALAAQLKDRFEEAYNAFQNMEEAPVEQHDSIKRAFTYWNKEWRRNFRVRYPVFLQLFQYGRDTPSVL